MFFFFFFQAEDGIRDIGVTGVQTCALPISVLFYCFWLGPSYMVHNGGAYFVYDQQNVVISIM